MMEDLSSRLVIIGTGCAGTELAFAARGAGWSGPIVLLGEEPGYPYHRPPLSKAYLAGEATAESLLLRAPELFARQGITLVAGVRAVAVDRASKVVRLASGESVPYQLLAFATGGRARQLPARFGLHAARNLHYLRDLACAQALRSELGAGRKLLVIGGGYIGLEVAAAATKAGMAVTVLEAAPRVLQRVTAPPVSRFYEDVHRQAGVDVRTNTIVDGFDLSADRRSIRAVRCTDGQRLEADVVVAGIGLQPNTELAAEAGLAVDDGIVIDDAMRTSDPAILAVGDCARYFSHLYGRSVRIESVPNSLDHARKAAALLCGKQARAEGAPWFWSDQYDLSLKTVGLSQGHDKIVMRGSPAARSFSAFYLKGRRVIAADTVNRAAEYNLARRMVTEQRELDPQLLADDAISLKDLHDRPLAAAR
jgi:3-phenylpropionate/trans-cinnamate dioxygenase ferredoxin reductase subunit